MAARQVHSFESLSEANTTLATEQTKATFSFTPDANSDYWIIFSASFTNSSGTLARYGACGVYHSQASKSVGWWATKTQELSTGTPPDWIGVFCVHKSTFGASPGQQDYVVQYNSSNGGDTTKIKDVRMLAIKADVADQYAAQDASTQRAANAGYGTRTTLTFTPATAGDYLLIASAVMTSEGASTTGTRLVHSGGSTCGENLIYHKTSWNYNAWATGAKINLAASSQTFDLQFSPSATVAADIENARILALRLDAFDNAYVAQDFTGGNNAIATDSDYLTLTQTPLALDHAVIAIGSFRVASTTVSGYLNVAKGGTNINEWSREGVNAAGYFYAGMARKETLTASSTDWKWRARSETAGTTVYADDLLIAVLQIEATPGGGGKSGTGAITSAATLSSAGNKQAFGTGSASSAATLSSTGRKQGLGIGSTSSTTSLDAAGDKQGLGTAAITGAAALSATGNKQASANGTITAAAALSSAGGKQAIGAGAITAVAGLASDGDKQAAGGGAVAAAASLASVGDKQALGTGAVTALPSFSSSGVAQTDIAKAGTGTIATGAALSSAGGKQVIGTGAIASPASLASIGGKQASGAVALSATTALFSTGGKQAIGTGAIAATGALSATAAKRGLGTGAIASAATLSATGSSSSRVILATSELMARRILVNTLAARRLMTTALAGKRTLISDLHGKAQP